MSRFDELAQVVRDEQDRLVVNVKVARGNGERAGHLDWAVGLEVEELSIETFDRLLDVLLAARENLRALEVLREQRRRAT